MMVLSGHELVDSCGQEALAHLGRYFRLRFRTPVIPKVAGGIR